MLKILLVGEFNRSHRFLKEGLTALGHEAIVIGLQDGFKKVEVDIPLKNYFEKGFLKIVAYLFYKILKIHLHSISIKLQLKKLLPQISNFDVVQFINESSFLCTPNTEKELFNLIKLKNKNIFLLSCGADYISVKYAFDKKLRYSILSHFFEKKGKKNHYLLKYLTPSFKELHNHIYKNIKGVIAADLDYHIPLLNHEKYLGLIPHPVNTAKIKFQPLEITDKIAIFHGINSNNYYKKGNDIFEKALLIIQEKYNDKVKIISTTDLPYKKYIKAFNSCHILLDQVYAYDQGYNALEAMAKGKVVFTGAEKEWLDYYHLQENTIAINALPDATQIAQKLEWLIENPKEILEISCNARQFVEKHHHHINCAKQFVKTWSSKKN